MVIVPEVTCRSLKMPSDRVAHLQNIRHSMRSRSLADKSGKYSSLPFFCRHSADFSRLSLAEGPKPKCLPS